MVLVMVVFQVMMIMMITHSTNPPAIFILLTSTFWELDSLLYTCTAGTSRWRTGWS